MAAFWHPFSTLATVEQHGELVIESGRGCWVTAADGIEFLDATAALWFANVGYGRADLVEAATRQMETLATYHTFGDLGNRPAAELAERISSLAPMPGGSVFFTSGGSDAVDTASKLARRYWSLRGRRSKTVVISRDRSYHGMHGFGTSLAGIAANRDGYGTIVGDVATVGWADSAELAAAIDRLDADRVAAFICEPVIGAGGVLFPPEGYLKEAQELCRDSDVLFIADEVVTGFGRAGDWFACNRIGLQPDLVVFAKGVTSGYLPLGGVIAAPNVVDPFRAPGVMWRHGYTYSGHATVCALALANIGILEVERLAARAVHLEELFAQTLGSLAGHDAVSEVRTGLGALAAVQFRDDLSADPRLAAVATAASREVGLLTRMLSGGALQVSPPLVISDAEVDEMVGRFSAALDLTLARMS